MYVTFEYFLLSEKLIYIFSVEYYSNKFSIFLVDGSISRW